MKHTIQVTEDDISHGVVNDCDSCPVALAMQRHFNNPKIVVFTRSWTIIEMHVKDKPLPEQVIEWITEFDEGEFVGPMEFEIEVMDVV